VNALFHRGAGKSPTGIRAGFTLPEMMIVCSLVAILLALAVPAYQRYLLRAYRADAITNLLATASCQERIYSTELSYDTNRCLVTGEDGKYRFRFEPPATASSTTFLVIAEPVNDVPQDICGNLSLDQSGRRGISGEEKLLRQCWAGR